MPHPVPVREPNLRDVLQKLGLTENSPPSVLINRKFDILYFHGDTGRYLTPPVGEPVFNLLKMARGDLRPRLLPALDECIRERRPVCFREVAVKDQNTGGFMVDLAVRPLAGEGLPPDLFLVAFENPTPAPIQAKNRARAGEAEIQWLASFPRLNVNPVLEMDLTGTITFCNQAGLAAVQSGSGARGPEAFLPEDLEYILAAALEQPDAVFYREVRVKDAVFAENISYVEPFKVMRIYATDITGRKRFEEALRNANAQLSALIENSPLAIMRLDEEGTILSCNPAGERMFGWSAAELVGQKIPFVPADELEIVREVLRRVSQGERFVGIERRRLRKDGSLIDVSVSVAPMYDEAGTFTGIVSLMEDITPRKEAEAALLESQAHYRSLFNNMLNGFAYCRMHFEQDRPVDFTYLEVNNAFEDLTGLKNVVGKKVSEVIPGIRESDPELLEICGRVALTGKPERFETYIESLKMWLSISLYSSRREYFVALFEVISERKQAEEVLRRSKEEWERTFDAVPDLIAILDEHHRIVRANRSMAQVLGQNRKT